MVPRCRASSRRSGGYLALCLLALASGSLLGSSAFLGPPARPPRADLAPAAALLAPLASLEAAPAWASDAGAYRMISGQQAAGGLGDAGSGNITLLIGCLAVIAAVVLGVSSLFKSFEDKPLP
mmetsp:Transcript_33918/g.91838  ORF Transcript_33918/g.91838 Transcript_33918/m.91838 type:complete len:123 (-) Transcript_33918:168-536(-)